MTDTELGYLAGFIDGEGSLIIQKRPHRGYDGSTYIGYSAYLDISNTNREVLEWIKRVTGATPGIYTRQMKGNRKVSYRLKIGYKQASKVIEQIYDLLVVKRPVAEVFLKYKDASTSEEKDELFAEAKKLNHRGL